MPGNTTPYISNPSVDDFALPQSKQIYTADLEADDEQTLTVPGDARAYKAVFRSEGTALVYMSVNGTARVATNKTFTASPSEILPECRHVRANDVLSFITPSGATDCEVSVAFYGLETTA